MKASELWSLVQPYVVEEMQNYVSEQITSQMNGVTQVTGTPPITVVLNATTPVVSHNVSGVVAGSYPKVTVDTFGHVTGGLSLEDADIPGGIARDTEVTSAISVHTAIANAHHNPVTVTDSSSVDLTLATQVLSAVVLPAGVNHDALQNYVADQHIAHSTVSISPGVGLTGGGTIAATRTLTVDQGFSPVWTGSHQFNLDLLGSTILPRTTDTYDLGSSIKLWRKGYLSELDAVVFAQNTITLLGGWLLISKNEGSIVGDILAATTNIDFGSAMTVNDFVIMRAAGKVEYMQVTALVSGTTYTVTRNLDGSGANDWAGGTPWANLGYTASGRIELNAYDTPRISIIEQGATYNAQTERIRIGDLVSWQSAGFTGYGLAMGNYSGNEYMVYSPTGGLIVRGTIRADDGFLGTLSVDGLLSLGTTGELRAGTATDGIRFGYMTDGYYLRGLSGGVTQVEIRASNGQLYAGGGKVRISATGIAITPAIDLPGPPPDGDPCIISWADGSGGLSKIYASASPYIGSHALALRSEAGISANLSLTSDNMIPSTSGFATYLLLSSVGTSYGSIVLKILQEGAAPIQPPAELIIQGLASDSFMDFKLSNISLLRLQYTSLGTIQVQLGRDGTAALPAFTWASDPNTGIFHTADVISLSTGGTERMSISSSGLDMKGHNIINANGLATVLETQVFS